MKQIGYFFGTFNPIHMGHLLMAQTALEQFDLNQICFIPAAHPPHRANDPDLAPYPMRLEMSRLACANNPRFVVSDIEGQREGPSYTIETLQLLHPHWQPDDARLSLIIGGDALANLGTWHCAEALIKRCTFLQALRQAQPAITHAHTPSGDLALDTQVLNMPQVAISSSLIRQYCALGRSLNYLTPPAVGWFISWNRPYH